MPRQPGGSREHFPLFRQLGCRKSKENGSVGERVSPQRRN